MREGHCCYSMTHSILGVYAGLMESIPLGIAFAK